MQVEFKSSWAKLASEHAVNNWNWDFGDGSTSTAQNPSHTYTRSGTFSVSLIATDNLGFMVTGIGQSVRVSPLTVAFGAAPQGSYFILSWPTKAPGFIEYTTNIPATSWATSAFAPAIVNGQFTVTNAFSGPSTFYQLIK